MANQDLYAELLPLTLEHARKAPFYREHWGRDGDIAAPTALEDLPLVTREDIQGAGERARVSTGEVVHEFFTGGTTGRPFVFVRGERELRYLSAFWREAHQVDTHETRIRAVHLINPYVATEVDIPQPVRQHRINVYQSGSFDHARAALERVWTESGVESRVTVIMGIERLQRALLAHCQRSHPDGVTNQLAALYTTGHLLTARLRRELTSYWGCPVVDRYGLSEVVGGATECLDCGWYHLDPMMVGEVVGHHSGETVSEGLGILVLTALYPFQRVQPMVRYVTGDLVEVTHQSPCFPGELAIKPLGRAFCGAPDHHGDDWFITPAALYEEIDRMDEVYRAPLFRDASQIPSDNRLGHPAYRVDVGFDPIRVLVRLRLRADVSPESEDRSLERLRHRLLATSPRLAALVARDPHALALVRSSDFAPLVISYVP